MDTMLSALARRAAALLLGFVLLASAAGVSLAQGWSAGLKGGVNVASMYGGDVEDAGYRTAFSGGLFATYYVHERVALQPEILFSMKGGEVDHNLAGAAEDVTYEFGYLEVPLLVKLNVPAARGLRPSLFAGPSFAYALYGDANDQDLEDDLKSTDVGVVVGASFDRTLRAFHLRQRSLMLDARYTFGLTNVFDLPGEPEARNGGFSFTVGFGI